MTSAKQIRIEGFTVENPRERAIQAVLLVNWPFVAPKMIGWVQRLPSFGGWRAQPVSAGANLAAVVEACRRQGALAIEIHLV